MGKVLIKNISLLAGTASGPRPAVSGDKMDSLSSLSESWLIYDDRSGLIDSFGVGKLPDGDFQTIDAHGGIVMPSYCDSHTHIVYSGSREREFLDKINGLSYEEIAANGGGILNSSDRVALASEDELYRESKERLDEVVSKGTGAIEIKSGYGLSTESELKMLRVIARLKESTDAVVRATFLGAHAVGRAYAGRQSEYVDMLISEMLPAVAAEGLADFVDVFCDKGFFSVNDTDRILTAAAGYGMRPKIHANELANSGGVQIGIKHDALSVDHLERGEAAEIKALAESSTIPTALPGASFFLNMPYAPAKMMVEAGLPLALASDYNPGSSPSGDMRFVMALACIKMRLTPSQAFNAVTVNGAHAMGVGDICGSIAPGMRANLIITKPLGAFEFIPYAYNTPYISHLVINGKQID
ncbi:MAG: imidazolonepropionase [Muribaculaceae bacterium]|nr:imidazolonepropionase [Muribaculaceae bacterium]